MRAHSLQSTRATPLLAHSPVASHAAWLHLSGYWGYLHQRLKPLPKHTHTHTPKPKQVEAATATDPQRLGAISKILFTLLESENPRGCDFGVVRVGQIPEASERTGTVCCLWISLMGKVEDEEEGKIRQFRLASGH